MKNVLLTFTLAVLSIDNKRELNSKKLKPINLSTVRISPKNIDASSKTNKGFMKRSETTFDVSSCFKATKYIQIPAKYSIPPTRQPISTIGNGSETFTKQIKNPDEAKLTMLNTDVVIIGSFIYLLKTNLSIILHMAQIAAAVMLSIIHIP